jgi:hypothetical protein
MLIIRSRRDSYNLEAAATIAIIIRFLFAICYFAVISIDRGNRYVCLA